MRDTYVSDVDYEELAAPIKVGGTGAATLPQAAHNLGLILQTQVSQPNGPIAIGSNGRIDPVKIPAVAGTNVVNVKNLFSVIVANQTVQFLITDYDSFKNYTVSASVGTVSRDGDTITYVAPGAPGPMALTINGRQINYTIDPGQPDRPSILVPANGSTGTSTTLNFQSSAFVAVGQPDTHASSDWQVATDANFTNIVQQTLNDTVNKTTWTPAAFQNVTTYYVRVRYKGASGNYSQYSTSSTFTTENQPAPTIDLNPTVSGQAGSGFFQQIGTYTGTVSSITTLIDGTPVSLAITYGGGAIYWNGNMPYNLNGAVLTVSVSNSGGSAADTANINLTAQPYSALQTQNWSFPVNQAIASFNGVGGRKWVAADAIIFGSVATGALPPGVSISYNQGGNGDALLGGTPTQTGTYNFTLSVTRRSDYAPDQNATTAQITITITP